MPGIVFGSWLVFGSAAPWEARTPPMWQLSLQARPRKSESRLTQGKRQDDPLLCASPHFKPFNPSLGRTIGVLLHCQFVVRDAAFRMGDQRVISAFTRRVKLA